MKELPNFPISIICSWQYHMQKGNLTDWGHIFCTWSIKTQILHDLSTTTIMLSKDSRHFKNTMSYNQKEIERSCQTYKKSSIKENIKTSQHPDENWKGEFHVFASVAPFCYYGSASHIKQVHVKSSKQIRGVSDWCNLHLGVQSLNIWNICLNT